MKHENATLFQQRYEVPEVIRDGQGSFHLIEDPLKGALVDPADAEQIIRPSEYNWATKIRSRAPVENTNKNTSAEEMRTLVGLVERFFATREKMYEVTALISGMPVHLKTNSPHLWNFWRLNWYLGDFNEVVARLDKPPITLRAAFGISDEKGKPLPTGVYYCPETREIVFVNTDYHGQCKSWALGAAGVGLADFDIHSIHGACVEIDGIGVLIIAPTGTGKSTYTNTLSEFGLMNSDDWVYVKEEKPGDFFAYPSERRIYVRSNAVKDDPWQGHSLDHSLTDPAVKKQFEIFEKSPAENVAQEGGKRIYARNPNSRVMIDPAKIWRLAYKTSIKIVILLRRDPESPYKLELTPDEAVKVLARGEYMIGPGVTDDPSKFGTLAYESWYNPYLLEPNAEFEARRFQALGKKGKAQYLVFNTHHRYAAQKTAKGEPDIPDLIRETTREMLEFISRHTGKKYM